MDLIEHLQQLFRYDAWANRQFLSSLQSNSTERSHTLLSHILSAERLWLERIEQKPQTFPVWPAMSWEECEAEITRLSAGWEKRLYPGADLSRQVAYKNSKGEAYKSREDDILFHVITHSAYHRGQIAADLRGAGFAPPYTDFIHAVRQRQLK